MIPLIKINDVVIIGIYIYIYRSNLGMYMFPVEDGQRTEPDV